MNWKSSFAVLAVAVLMAAPLLAEKDEKDPLKGVKCPVSGKAAVQCAADHNGGKVYFCCGKCAAAFKKDNTKFVAKANHQLYVTKQAKLEKCIYSGKKLNGETVIEVAGAKVCFCCPKCKAKAEKAEDVIAAVFNDKAFAKGFKVAKKEKK